MNQKEIEKGKRAYSVYRGKAEGIEEEILSYLKGRIYANRDTITNLLSVTKEEFHFEKVEEFFQKTTQYKSDKNVTTDETGFIAGTLISSKGLLLKEENAPEKVVEYFVDAILSRNAVVIADMDYSEISVKKLILEIFQEALRKFELDENLIQLLPYEEVNDEEFSKYSENNNHYIYLEDEMFAEQIPEGEAVLRGSFEEVVDEINKAGICECAVIYTKDRGMAYKFLNEVNGRNVFVNAGYENIHEGKVEEYYIYKNVLYPTK